MLFLLVTFFGEATGAVILIVVHQPIPGGPTKTKEMHAFADCGIKNLTLVELTSFPQRQRSLAIMKRICTVCDKRYRLRVKPKDPWICSSCKRAHWTREEISFLRSARSERITIAKIADHLKKPEITVQRKLKRLRIKKPKPPKKYPIKCSVCGEDFLRGRTIHYAMKDSYVCRDCKKNLCLGK